MKTYLCLLLLSAMLFSCKKEKNSDDNNKQFSVEGLMDFQMMQGYDTVVIPITVKSISGNTEPLLLSVTNLPDNLIADIETVDSVNGKYNIRFVTYYAIIETSISMELGLKVGEVIKTGSIDTRLIVSTKDKAQQFQFKIAVTPHPVLSIAGDYYQYCQCPSPFDTARGNKVRVWVVSVFSDSVGTIAFDSVLQNLGGGYDDIKYPQVDASQRKITYTWIEVPDWHPNVTGYYDDTSITITMGSATNCQMKFVR